LSTPLSSHEPEWSDGSHKEARQQKRTSREIAIEGNCPNQDSSNGENEITIKKNDNGVL
jgi:hypothetical protein